MTESLTIDMVEARVAAWARTHPAIRGAVAGPILTLWRRCRRRLSRSTRATNGAACLLRSTCTLPWLTRPPSG